MRGDFEQSRKFFQVAYNSVQQCKAHKFQLIEYESYYLNTCTLSSLTISALYKKSRNIQLVTGQLNKLKGIIDVYTKYSHSNRDVDIRVFTDIYGYSPYNAIVSCYTYMYENTRNKLYLDSAFYFSEINKTQWTRVKPSMSEFLQETNADVKNDHVLIQYGEYGFLHKTYLYAIIKNKNGTYFLPLGSDKIIRENLLDVYQWKGYKLHASKSYHLYKEIFKPLETYIPEKTKKIIITKTNFLDAVNFESLVVDSNKSMTTLPFLLRRYPVFVQPSLRLFKSESCSKQIRTVSIHASNYKNSNVSKIHFMRDTLQSWITEKKIQKVNNNFSKQDLLIVAAHGFSGSHRVDDAYIDLGDSKLTIRKVCRMNLKVNQTILAICDGGLGQHISSGSTFSFASAFLFAGSSSCVYATWKLDDYIGASMITTYLKRIEAGEQKDWALHNAKLDYLKHVTSEEGYNPIYWAGLQVMGDVSPVEIGKSYVIWYYIVGLILLVGVGFVIKKGLRLRSA
jgi:mannose/fructose-specific phosphotransferase system component IIA